MTRVKKFAFAALTALALVAGAVVTLAEAKASPALVADDAERGGKATPILF